MDAAAHAELDALRRRAFGPDADIHDDPAALARLIELEDVARASAMPDEGPPDGPQDGPVAAAASDPPPSPLEGRRRSRARIGMLLAGAAAATAIVAAGLSQPSADPAATPAPTSTVPEEESVFVADPRAETLVSIRRDGAFGGYIELPAETPPPPFPATAPLRWAAFLGDYYGWDLWIAGGVGGADDEHCILIQRGDETRARCEDAAGQRQGTLYVSLAGIDILPEELPQPLAQYERIRFWWLDSGSVDVVRGPFDLDGP